MNNEASFRRLAAISAILSAPLGLVAVFIVFLAVDFNLEAMSDQSVLITLGSRAAGILAWGEFLSIFGYYLLLAPVAIYLWQWLRPKHPGLVSLFTFCGLGFILVGVPGAAIRATVMPEMMRAYALASGAEREILRVVFTVLTDFVFAAVGPIETILIGVWLLGTGLLLRREQRMLGMAAAALGIAALGAEFGTAFGFETLEALHGLIWFFLPLWAFWLGFVIWRSSEKGEHAVESAAAV